MSSFKFSCRGTFGIESLQWAHHSMSFIVRQVPLLILLCASTCSYQPAFAQAASAPLGSAQTVVLCIVAATGTQGPCPSGQVQSTGTFYLVDPINSSLMDFTAMLPDGAIVSGLFAAGFCLTMFFLITVWMASSIYHRVVPRSLRT
jgi:hypothetical protein